MENKTSEVIGDLPPAAVDRVIDSADTRLYRKPGVEIFNMNAPHIDYSQAILQCDNPVPVYGSEWNQIGYANVYVSGLSCIFADLIIDYHTAERLIIETGSFPIYPAVSGTVQYRNGFDSMATLDNYTQMARVDIIRIYDIRLRPTPCADNRIEPIR
ncbi:MAG: hypothetical protein NVS9B9_19710 [Ktedonobacteraceae bacterium]